MLKIHSCSKTEQEKKKTTERGEGRTVEEAGPVHRVHLQQVHLSGFGFRCAHGQELGGAGGASGRDAVLEQRPLDATPPPDAGDHPEDEKAPTPIGGEVWREGQTGCPVQ